jgi:hypothetical protein
MPPQMQRLHADLTLWFYDLIIESRAGKAPADTSSRNKDERDKGDIPMKKILIAVSALAMFAAFSGIASAGEEGGGSTTKTEKSEQTAGKTKKSVKKTDKASDGTTATTEKTTEQKK